MQTTFKNLKDVFFFNGHNLKLSYNYYKWAKCIKKYNITIVLKIGKTYKTFVGRLQPQRINITVLIILIIIYLKIGQCPD